MSFHAQPRAQARPGRSVAGVRSWLVIIAAVLLGGLAACAASAVARDWARPVDGAVVRPFSVDAADRFAAGQHRGIDLAAAPGARVRAACAGRVSFAGRVPGGGRTVSVRCGPLIATYQHLGSVSVTRGQAVLPGARIGRSGRGAPVPHVHLGARVAATGAYRDPAALFGGPPWPLAPVPAPHRAPPAAPPGARPLGPAPTPVPVPVPVPEARPAPSPAPPARAARGRLPWPVWLGLALVALGLPLGGGLVAARRRRRLPRPARHGAASSRAVL